MPVKKRAAKGRTFDEYMRQQLLEGPDACLLAGVGYLAPYRVARLEELTDDEEDELIAAMRADWHRHGAALMRWWNGGEPDVLAKPWAYVVPRGPESPPWAFHEFGEPECQ